jgi:heme a synthase
MAGLKAAAVASTWPDINGAYVPTGMFSNGFLHDAVHNKIAIHFIHRNLAYLITIVIAVWWWRSRKVTSSHAFNKAKHLAVWLVVAQVSLGILAVITSPHARRGSFGAFEWSAQLHQLFGMVLFLTFAAIVYLTKRKQQHL